ncbi:acetyltransferase (GNAT) family protein [Lutibacter oceani]|uniref:Acetyltransferase (GNAT) family protein n=1 Tax=Lutibacter oceani TaxID=1853311 RepID=A0A3D9RVC3_9FLAO|nr:GNAT family N-acetyltransferase [Lutibacter oceani]REE80592.1 acetyltransferase (GNAT) family protein [Lutibacter oceani]
MDNFKIYNKEFKPTEKEKKEIVAFLFKHLQEYGDKTEDISKCFDFAVKDSKEKLGGFVLALLENGEIKGVTIVNKTGMSGYIPENILVYIAVHEDARGKGFGKKLMNKAIELADGDIALHVEPNNPAKILYEKLGFENKYLEMRLKKQL